MKVLLIYPSLAPSEVLMPPLSIYALAAILKNEGFETSVIEPTQYGKLIIEEEIVEELLEGVDVIGISCNSAEWSISKRLTEVIHKINPKVPIILGGVHPSFFDEYVLLSSKANYVVRGEGEVTLVKLLLSLRGKLPISEVSGITYRKADGTIAKTLSPPLLSVARLRQFPLPAYELIPTDRYKCFTFETSRGCPNQCFFCAIRHHRSWRGLEAEDVIERLQQILPILRQRGLNMIYLVDDCFTTDAKRVIEICNLIKAENIKCEFGIEARVNDLLKPGVIEALAKTNIWLIQIGVECGYDQGLRNVRKGTNISKVKKCAEALRAYGLSDKSMYSFIIGFPWETKKDWYATIHFAADMCLKHGLIANITRWVPYPAPVWWQQRKTYSLNIDERIYDEPCWASKINLDQEFNEKEAAKIMLLKDFYAWMGTRMNISRGVIRSPTPSAVDEYFGLVIGLGEYDLQANRSIETPEVRENDTLQLARYVRIRNEDGNISIVMDQRSGRLQFINRLAAQILKLTKKASCIKEIVSVLTLDYQNVSQALLQRDTVNFLNYCLRVGLISITKKCS